MEEPSSGTFFKIAPIITQTEESRFSSALHGIESYSRTLVQSFDGAVSKIHSKLCSDGGIAARSLSALGSAGGDLDRVARASASALESLISDVDSVLADLQGLDALESEILLLSDLLTTVEDAVKRSAQ